MDWRNHQKYELYLKYYIIFRFEFCLVHNYINNNNQFSLLGGYQKITTIKIRKNQVTDTTSPYPFAKTESYSFLSVGDVVKDTVIL